MIDLLHLPEVAIMTDMKSSSERTASEEELAKAKAGSVRDDSLSSIAGGAAKGGSRNSVATGKLSDDDLGSVSGGRAQPAD